MGCFCLFHVSVCPTLGNSFFLKNPLIIWICFLFVMLIVGSFNRRHQFACYSVIVEGFVFDWNKEQDDVIDGENISVEVLLNEWCDIINENFKMSEGGEVFIKGRSQQENAV